MGKGCLGLILGILAPPMTPHSWEEEEALSKVVSRPKCLRDAWDGMGWGGRDGMGWESSASPHRH